MTSPQTHALTTVSDWLNYMGSIHSSAIDMGLERVLPVFKALNVHKNAFVFTVAGTNGKGSTTATIAKICQEAGKKVALYQSPHLVSFNERIVLNGNLVDDETLIQAFEIVEKTRVACNLSLSFFEMTTLAAFWIFAQSDFDVWVLEIGLGGRLDVVNLIDPDVCVITNVAIDHIDWLGDTREKIGFEKAGILRQNSTLIYGENDMPVSVAKQIDKMNATCYQYGKDFLWVENDENWHFSSSALTLALPKPSLALHNVAVGVSAVLASGLGIDENAIIKGVETVSLAGRLDLRTIQGKTWLFDVAHNEAGVNFLLTGFNKIWEQFAQQNPNAKLHLVFSMLGDKDVAGVLSLIFDFIDKNQLPLKSIHIGELDSPRALAIDKLSEWVQSGLTDKGLGANLSVSKNFDELIDNFNQCDWVADDDFVLAFGSFHTISESLIVLGQCPDFKPL